MAAMRIHELTATELLAGLERGELSSVEIVRALGERIEGVNPRLNCFVMRRPEEVEAEARAADAARQRGDDLGPLAGLPLTVKDNIDLTGADSTMGLRSRRGRPATDHAPVVRALVEAGAIVLGKTNVPQLLLAQETENAIWGVTRNPWNLDRVPGGSSGGEAAAIASGMSPCGIGTDIGGSIRIPAHFCGICGFKPTLDRWSNRGSQTAVPGQELVRAQMGPLARRMQDLTLLMRAVSQKRLAELDPQVAPLAVGDPAALDLAGLRVGFYEDDGYLSPARSLRRAVRLAREALEDAGVTLVEYQPPAAKDLIYVWLGAISADRGRTIERQLRGEEISPQLKPSRVMMSLPKRLRQAMAAVAGRLGEHRLARLLQSLGEKSVTTLWSLTARRTEIRLAEFDAWNRLELDAVLCPPHVVPALGHRESGDFTLSLANVFRWTLLNFPAGVVPVTRVQPDETRETHAGRPDRVERKVAAVAARSAGLPVGVQVVSRPYRDEVALALMQAIEARVSRREDYPTTPVDV